MKYVEKKIMGVEPSMILPKGWSLVLEGGGTRGFFSCGVFDAFMEERIMFPYVIGVSAGAANSLSYLSGQMGRSRQIVAKYVSKHQYISVRNMFKYGSLFRYDYVFNTIPEKFIFWDRDVFLKNKSNLLVGTTDCNTGNIVWHDKKEIINSMSPVIASCSVPFFSKIVNYNNKELLDGGIASPIPIDKAILDGNTFHVVVLTRNEGYTKKPLKYKRLVKAYYKGYPKLVEILMTRDKIYNSQLKMCEQLEKEGKAIIIRPVKKLTVGRVTRKKEDLLDLYDQGYEEGKIAVAKILKQYGKEKI